MIKYIKVNKWWEIYSYKADEKNKNKLERKKLIRDLYLKRKE